MQSLLCSRLVKILWCLRTEKLYVDGKQDIAICEMDIASPEDSNSMYPIDVTTFQQDNVRALTTRISMDFAVAERKCHACRLILNIVRLLQTQSTHS